jgi:hypothetical protein
MRQSIKITGADWRNSGAEGRRLRQCASAPVPYRDGATGAAQDPGLRQLARQSQGDGKISPRKWVVTAPLKRQSPESFLGTDAITSARDVAVVAGVALQSGAARLDQPGQTTP